MTTTLKPFPRPRYDWGEHGAKTLWPVLAQGRASWVIDEFCRLTEQYPKSADAHAGMALCQLAQGKPVWAASRARTAYRLNPQHTIAAALVRGLVGFSPRTAEAERLLEDGYRLFRAGAYADAGRRGDNILAKHGNDLHAARLAGHAYLAAGLSAIAEERLRHAITLGGADAQDLSGIALALHARNKAVEAAKVARQVPPPERNLVLSVLVQGVGSLLWRRAK